MPVEVSPDFPQDMVEEIFSRVHPKELCAYKTVSKDFNNLIKSKSFQLNNMKKMEALDRAVYIFQEEFLYAPLFYHINGIGNADNGRRVTAEERDVEILTSSGGLVLFCNSKDKFYLFNPLSDESSQLPTCKLQYPAGCTSAQTFFGMGYLFEEDDYKIVRVSGFSPTFQTEVVVYSRNMGAWKRTTTFPSNNPITQAGVQLYGRLHWISMSADGVYSITAFDLKTETYSSFGIPNIPTSYPSQKLVDLDSETLALSCSMVRERGVHILWILRNYTDDSSWYMVEINLADIGEHFGLMTVRPLSFMHPHRQSLLIRVDPSGVFGIYDIATQLFNRIGHEDLGLGFMTPHRFYPSLHSPYPKILDM